MAAIIVEMAVIEDYPQDVHEAITCIELMGCVIAPAHRILARGRVLTRRQRREYDEARRSVQAAYDSYIMMDQQEKDRLIREMTCHKILTSRELPGWVFKLNPNHWVDFVEAAEETMQLDF